MKQQLITCENINYYQFTWDVLDIIKTGSRPTAGK